MTVLDLSKRFSNIDITKLVCCISKNSNYRLQFIASTVLNIIYCICFYYVTFLGARNDYPAICLAGHLIHNYLGLFICVFGYLLSLRLYQNGQTNYLSKNLKIIDRKLFAITQTKVSHDEQNQRFNLKCFVVIVLAFTGIVVCDSFIFFHIFNNAVIVSIVYTFPYVFGTIIQGQFISAVHEIYMRLIQINRLLTHISNNADNNSKVVNAFGNIDQNEQMLKPQNRIQNIKVDSMISNNENPFDEPDKKAALFTRLPKNVHSHLHTIFEQHEKLLEMSEWINNIYSVQIVTFVSVAFVIVLFGFFFETKVIFWLWGQNTRLVLIALSYLLWSTLMLVIIYTLLSICTYTRDESNKTALIVHKILQKKPIFVLNDSVYYNKLKSFTLKILHRKASFKFNGLGLFVLDFTFIFSAVSAATSYLIVLLQFDLSADLQQ